MIELTTEQGQAIGEAPGPVSVIDPATKREFVLLSAEAFARLQASQGDLDPRDAYAAVDRAFAAGWNDKKMDDYDDYEKFQRRLFEAGLLSEIKPPITDFTTYDNRQAVTTQGEPVSQTIIRERR